jgi:hypothetical protein
MSHEREVLREAWRRRYPASAALLDAVDAAGGAVTARGRELWAQLRAADTDAARDWAGIAAFLARYHDVNLGADEAKRLDELCRRHGYMRFLEVEENADGLACTIGVVDDRRVVAAREVPVIGLTDAERDLLDELRGSP